MKASLSGRRESSYLLSGIRNRSEDYLGKGKGKPSEMMELSNNLIMVVITQVSKFIKLIWTIF